MKQQRIEAMIKALMNSIYIQAVIGVDNELEKAYTVVCRLSVKADENEAIRRGIAMGRMSKAIEDKDDNQKMAAIRAIFISLFNHWYGISSTMTLEQIDELITSIKAHDKELKEIGA